MFSASNISGLPTRIRAGLSTSNRAALSTSIWGSFTMPVAGRRFVHGPRPWPRGPANNYIELKSPKTPKSPEISSPTNFKHITHTRPHDFRKMGAASENDLLAEFSAVRAAQTSRQHVHGMKLSDLSSRNSVAEYAASVPSLSSDSSRSSIHNPRTSAPLTKRHMRPIRSKESFSLPFRDGHCRYRAVEPRTPSGPPSSPADLCTAQDVGYTPLCLPPHVGQSLLVEPAHDRSEDHPGYSFQPDASAHGVQDAAHANAYFHAQTTTDDDGQWQTPIVPQYNYHAALWSVDEERNSLDRSRPTSTMNTGLCTQLPLPSVTRKPLNPTYTQSMRPSIAMSNFKFPENTKAPPRSNMRYDFVHMEPKENRQGSLNRSSLTEGLFSSWTTDSDTGSEVGDEVPIIEKPPHLVTNQKAEEQHPARPSNTRSKSFPEPPSHPPPTLPLPAIPMPSSEPSESSESSPVSENPASKDPLPSLASYREPTGLKVSAAVAMLETKTDPTHAASKDRLAVAESRPRQTQAKQKPDVHKIQTTQAGTVAPVTVASAPLEGSMTRQAEAMSPDVADLQPEMRPDASPIMRRRGNSVKSVRFKDDMCTFRDIETPQNPEPEPIPAYNHVQANLEDLQQTLLKLELEMSRPLRDGYVDKVLKPAVPAFAVGKAEAGQSKKRKTQATEMPAILPRTSSLPQKATRHHRGGSSDGSMTLPPGSPQPAVSAVTA